MVAWVLAHALIACEPRTTHPPLVDLAVWEFESKNHFLSLETNEFEFTPLKKQAQKEVSQLEKARNQPDC